MKDEDEGLDCFEVVREEGREMLGEVDEDITDVSLQLKIEKKHKGA